jgi:hypothetical protein
MKRNRKNKPKPGTDTTVYITLPLYCKMDMSHKEGEPLTAEEIRHMGNKLQEHFAEAADFLDLLAPAGWKAQVVGGEVGLFHPDVHTQAQVEENLGNLGLEVWGKEGLKKLEDKDEPGDGQREEDEGDQIRS